MSGQKNTMKVSWITRFSHIPSTSTIFIKNIHAPICKNCLFYVNNKKQPSSAWDDTPTRYGHCKRFGIRNIITGEVEYEYATVARQNRDKCGQEGKYFVTNATSIVLVKK